MDNKYTVKVFGAGDAGEFMDPEGLDLDVWLQDRAEGWLQAPGPTAGHL